MIALALVSALVGGGQQRVHLRLLEIRDRGRTASLERDVSDLPGPLKMLGAVLADEPGERMEGAKPLIPGRDRASTARLQIL